MDQPIIPGLPDDLALRCLARLSHGYHGVAETVSKRWRDVIRSAEYSNYKAWQGWCGDWLFVLTGRDTNQWIAYDPGADRWHPLPPLQHPPWDGIDCFSCACANNKFFRLGGNYWRRARPTYFLETTAEVFQFDPCKKEWSRCASMRTPRSYHACCVVDGKIYAAGGWNKDCLGGLRLAEVYDPLTDKWEDLLPMPVSWRQCTGIAYKGKFHVIGPPWDRNRTQVYDPLNRKWQIKCDTWPLSRAPRVPVGVTEDDQVYRVEDYERRSIIKTRDAEAEEWYTIGRIPPVHYPGHARPLEVFNCGFSILGHELYAIGGQVNKPLSDSPSMLVPLNVDAVRVCDPTCLPLLSWREARPIHREALGEIVACASLKESSS